ncbi:phosphoribosylglycinamide formyltransferase [bacterium]|nr:phosphoribosylglycinamide formyltransferase [bacterium]
MSKLKIGVLVSGGGTNLQAIIDSCESGRIDAEVALVISNKKGVYSLERARRHNIEALFINPKEFKAREDYSKKIAQELERRKVDLACLAGWLLKLEPCFVEKFKGRMINIHPALLPSFGGDGMYGHHVHEAVLASGAKVSGCTVHFVDEAYDHGPIILQTTVRVADDDTPDTLAERILKEEHKLYSKAIKLYIDDRLKIEGRRVKIINREEPDAKD